MFNTLIEQQKKNCNIAQTVCRINISLDTECGPKTTMELP